MRKGFSPSQKIKILFLSIITLVATFVATMHSGTVSAQE
jgi:hypothetical protein